MFSDQFTSQGIYIVLTLGQVNLRDDIAENTALSKT